MEKNVGVMDRKIRFVIGIAIIALGIIYQSWLGVIGLLPIATALLRWCPPYAMLGINTHKKHQPEP